MIVSVSRRCDIPAFYSDWFWARMREGYALVRNPMNHHQVSRVDLTPDAVDGIVFWTKNPSPMLEKLSSLDAYTYYFQFTLNAYARDIEPYVPAKSNVLLPVFMRLSDAIGPERVVWRYDPILLSERYAVDYHQKYFERLAKALCRYTKKCIISFIDIYPSIAKKMAHMGIQAPDEYAMGTLAKALSQICQAYSFTLETCSEAADLSAYGIGHARCVDSDLLQRLSGRPLHVRKDRNMRPACGCAASVDIGAYDTCTHGCVYCYACHGTPAHIYDSSSPLLCGALSPNDAIRDRKQTKRSDASPS